LQKYPVAKDSFATTAPINDRASFMGETQKPDKRRNKLGKAQEQTLGEELISFSAGTYPSPLVIQCADLM